MNQLITQPRLLIDDSLRASLLTLTDALGLNPSLSLDWCELCLSTVGNSAIDAAYFIDGAGASVSGFMPYFLSRARMAGIPMTVLQPASNLISYHAELVAAHDRCHFLRTFLEAAPRWDVFHFGNVDVSSDTSAAIQTVAGELGAPLQTIVGDTSPYISIRGSWTEFLQTRNKKFRYKVRRRREVMEGEGLRLVWYGHGDDAERLFSDLLQVESRSWKARSGIDIGSDPGELAYHRKLLPFLAMREMLFACVLYSGQQPIAYSLCCHKRDTGWVGQLKTSFDESYKHLSPGGIVIDASIERAFAVSALEFDFLGNQGEHKLYWTSLARSHADYFLFAPRVKSRLVGWSKLLKARAMTRSSAAEGNDNSGEG